jgi:LysR family transcriptional regulator, transcriptional activator of the cysJI operon
MDIDSSCFKAFVAASQTLNFTEAARLVGMTQSGISQHVAKLEKDLSSKLFLRIGKKVILTESGKALLRFIESYQDQVNNLKDQVQEGITTIKGKISYSMPATCLLSPHFNLFLEHRKIHFPELELKVDLHPSEDVIKQVLAAKINFGFVTKKILNEELEYQSFCEEEYVLVTNSQTQLKPITEWSWISYPGSEVLIEAWLKHQDSKLVKNMSMKIIGQSNSLHAAFTMVAQGLGSMIVPRHCVEASHLKEELKIHNLGKKPAKNMIYIVVLKSGIKPRRIKVAIDAFHKIKHG